MALAASLAVVPSVHAADPAAAGAAVFTTVCAVCHGPQGAGIPGSFPPLREQVTAFAKTPEGRDYLVMVVSAGLIGDLPVAGLTYHGVMPPQSALSEADVAAVLSYVAGGMGKVKPAPHAFTPQEVASTRARHAGLTGQAQSALAGSAWLASQLQGAGYIGSTGSPATPNLSFTANAVLALASAQGASSTAAARGLAYLEANVQAAVQSPPSTRPPGRWPAPAPHWP